MRSATLLWRSLERGAATRRATLLVAAAAASAHTLLTLAFPVVEGRDYITYLRVYAELGSWDSVIPWEMLWRMPVAPLVLGLPLDLGGLWAARLAAALFFVVTVVAWYRVGLRFEARVALVLALVLMLSPSLNLLFHRYSSDLVTGLVFALLALVFIRVWEKPTAGRVLWLGLLLAAFVLTRPAHQVVLLLALAPLVAPGRSAYRGRLTALCALTALVPTVGWALLNGERYDDRALSRGAGAWLPFYRAYVTDGIIDPRNGPASRRLDDLVTRELLPHEPYRSYGITPQRFWGEPATRYHEDLVGLTDRAYGWETRNRIMRDAALEAVRERPLRFARGVATSLVRQLEQPVQLLPPAAEEPAAGGTINVEGKDVPRPSEGGSIPAARFSYWLSRPDNAFDEVWTSPTEHHVVSSNRALLARLDKLERRVAGLHLTPSHRGSTAVMLWVNRLSRVFPPALLWLVVAAVAWLWRRPAGISGAAVLAFAAFAVLSATILSVPPLPEFGTPFYPAFALVGLAAVFAARKTRRAISEP